jgi:Cu(I)/Ag(I) efflux system membrane fusion protein
MTRFERAKFILKVVEVRLRFLAVLVVTGLVLGNWDRLANTWDKWTRPARPAAAKTLAPEIELFCPMHPSVVRYALEANGEVPKCPICGMPLSERRKGSAASLGAGRVQLSPERIELAGVKTAVVGFLPLVQVIEASGSVQYDESRLSKIVTRVNGYLEKLYVNKSFIPVEEGEPLAEIYSPELYTAIRELLLSTKPPGNTGLENASRERLRLLGVDEKEIDKIAQSGKSDYRIVIRSPQSGHVIQRDVVRGSYVAVGTSLFEVADLSTVWIEAYVYEKDLPFLREGMQVEAWVEAVPNRAFTGTIALVHPHVEAATRTNTVRFTVDNPDHLLRPGMFATVRIETPLSELAPWKSAPADSAIVRSGSVLAVPERAVIDTGSKKVVYVEREPGLFEAVRVELGPRVGDDYPVLSGLSAGEHVASAGAFLIDAETRLNPAAASTFAGAAGGPTSSPSPTTSSAGESPIDPERWKELSPEDRRLALEQRTCPISNDVLGEMGTPVKVIINGKAIFLCCKACKPQLEERTKKSGGQ